jgi:transposase-like protein
VEVQQPKGFGRVRMRHIPDASDFSLRPFVCDMVAEGSTVLTDGWSGYSRLSQCGYTHKKTVLSSSGDPAHVAMPGVHRIASLLKRWILGTHQGSVSDAHLQSYLEELNFRHSPLLGQGSGGARRSVKRVAAAATPLCGRPTGVI